MTWTSPNAPTMTLAGFRSRWSTPRLWAKPTAWHTCVNACNSPGRSAVFSSPARVCPAMSFMARKGEWFGSCDSLMVGAPHSRGRPTQHQARGRFHAEQNGKNEEFQEIVFSRAAASLLNFPGVGSRDDWKAPVDF